MQMESAILEYEYLRKCISVSCVYVIGGSVVLFGESRVLKLAIVNKFV